MKRFLALPVALALLALFAFPAFAQSGTITITIDCGAPESISLVNNTDEDLVLESLTSSVNPTSGNEIDLGDVEVAAGNNTTVAYGDSAGGGNIFNNDETETATVTISGDEFELMCDMGGTVTEEFRVGAQVEPTTAPVPVQPEPGVVETPTPTMPKVPSRAGGGGLAGGGIPIAPLVGALSLLAAGGVVALRRR